MKKYYLIIIFVGVLLIGMAVTFVVTGKKKTQPRQPVIHATGSAPVHGDRTKMQEQDRARLTRQARVRTVTLSLQNKNSQAFTFQLDEKQFARNRRYLVVGRDSQFSDIVIPDGSVSAQHFGLLWGSDGTISIEDRNSTNGTQIGGHRIISFKAVSLTGTASLVVGDLTGTVSVD